MMSTSEVNSCRPRVERDIAVLKHSDAYIALWKYLTFSNNDRVKVPFSNYRNNKVMEACCRTIQMFCI